MPTAARLWDGDSLSIDRLFGFDPPRQKDVGAIQLANGDVWMFWSDSLQANAPEFGYDLVGILFDAYGQRKTDRVVLNSGFFAGNEQEPSAAALPSGEFVLAFAQERPNETPPDPTVSIVIEKRQANGAYGGGLTIAADPLNGERVWFGDPAVAIAGASDGLVVYQRMSSGTWDICFQRFDPSTMTLLSTPAGGVVLDNDRNLTDPRIALLSNGNYLVAFTSTAANNLADRDAYFRIYNASGSPVSSLVGLNPSGRESSVEIAVLTGDRFAIGFVTANGARVEVYSNTGASLFGADAGGGLSDLLPTADGGFVVVNGNEFGYAARTFNASGQLVGQSTGIANAVSEYAVTPLADGRFFGAGLFQQDVSGLVYAVGDIFDTRETPTAPAYPSATQFGTPGDDDVDVSAAAAIFNGGPGDDIIRDAAPAGTTLLMGGEGSDTIVLRGLVAGVRARGGDLVSDRSDFYGDTLELTQESARVFFNMSTGVLSLPGVQATAVDFEHYRHTDGGGVDSVVGTSGNNRIETGPGTDTLNGGGGADILVGGTGMDGLLGGPGDDILYVDNAGDQPAEAVGEGFDRVLASVSFALSDSYESEIEILATSDPAGTAPIALTGNAFGQTIIGNAGANVLSGGGGDRLEGGAGNDWYYATTEDTVVEGAAEGTGDRVLANASYTLGAGVFVEMLTTTNNAGTAAINLTGNELAQAIYGNAGANTLDGKAGADTLVGLGGNDFHHVDNAADRIVEGAGEGTDRVFASLSYVLGAGAHVETMTTSSNSGTAAINLTGNELAQAIYGNAGANILDGKAGADTLVGFGGNDFYHVDNATDRVVESAGEGTADRIFASTSYVLGAGVHVELMTTNNNLSTAALNLTGNELGQTIYGNAGANILDGKGGTDTLVGLGGNDFYHVDNVADRVVEGAGEGTGDRIFASVSYALGAGVQVEMMTTSNNAGTAAIALTGNELANTIYGNAGANIIDGKGGADALVGLGGADQFRFTTAPGGGNVDRIIDFVSGIDRIALDDAVFAGLAPGTLAADAFVTGTAATDAGDRIIYNAATGQLFHDADGSGGQAAILFATLDTKPALTAADFLVI